MIAFLRGNIIQKTLTFLIVERNGIGYKVFVTPELLERPTGSELELYTYLKSSDDGQTLFGMPDFPTLQFFELLITVTGVGPKMMQQSLPACQVSAKKRQSESSSNSKLKSALPESARVEALIYTMHLFR